MSVFIPVTQGLQGSCFGCKESWTCQQELLPQRPLISYCGSMALYCSHCFRSKELALVRVFLSHGANAKTVDPENNYSLMHYLAHDRSKSSLPARISHPSLSVCPFCLLPSRFMVLPSKIDQVCNVRESA